ncbi:MAG: hypothetical protein AAGG75_27040 [Bacteroidota bacterium]
MKKSFYVFAGYSIGLMLCGSFFFTMYYIFQFQFVLGLCIAAVLLLITAIILCDSDLIQEIDFDESRMPRPISRSL